MIIMVDFLFEYCFKYGGITAGEHNGQKCREETRKSN